MNWAVLCPSTMTLTRAKLMASGLQLVLHPSLKTPPRDNLVQVTSLLKFILAGPLWRWDMSHQTSDTSFKRSAAVQRLLWRNSLATDVSIIIWWLCHNNDALYSQSSNLSSLLCFDFVLSWMFIFLHFYNQIWSKVQLYLLLLQLS